MEFVVFPLPLGASTRTSEGARAEPFKDGSESGFEHFVLRGATESKILVHMELNTDKMSSALSQHFSSSVNNRESLTLPIPNSFWSFFASGTFLLTVPGPFYTVSEHPEIGVSLSYLNALFTALSQSLFLQGTF